MNIISVWESYQGIQCCFPASTILPFNHPCSSSTMAKTQCKGIPAYLSNVNVSPSLRPHIAPSRRELAVRATRTKEKTSLEEDKD